MSKITDRIKAVVADATDGDAAKIDAAIKRKHAASTRAKEREAEIERAGIAHDAADRAYDLAARTASGPDDAALAKLKRELDASTANLDFLRRALRGDRRAIEEADQELHVLGRDKHIKTFKRKTTECAKCADRLSAAIREYVDAAFAYYEITGEIVSAYPFGTLPGGCNTTRNEVFDLIAKEVSRLNPAPALDDGSPRVPGGYNNPLVNAARFTPLKDQVAASNAYLMRIIEHGPAPSLVPQEKPKAKPAAIEPNDLILHEPAASAGPVVSAQQVMAGIQHRKLSVGG